MIDVAFTGAEARPARVAVVIDVLRATSTVAAALVAGYERVICADSIERALGLRGEGRVLAGERRCVMPEGFDQGNSPREASELRGRELVLATTNGAPATVAAAAVADEVLLASLLNLDAVLDALRALVDPRRAEIQLVCSGTGGTASLEDAYLAGRIAAALPGPRSDAALICEGVAAAYTEPVEALSAGANARLLRDAGLDADIEFCAATSRLRCVPTVVDAREGVAVVADAAAARPREHAAEAAEAAGGRGDRATVTG